MIQRNASIALFFLVCLLSTLNVSAWKPPHRFPRPLHAQPRSTDASSSEFIYETRFFTNKVDHFSFRPKSYRTYQQRYLFNDTFWDRSQGAMFFYAGNEGSIEWFARNTGFMWQLAQQQKALLVFAEHRFYGASMPSKGHLSLLTAEQALADFAVLLTSLKQNLTAQSTPVIAFGGSYGGMLAAWMRLKYPHVISGAIASSAPILWFEDLTPVDSFERIVTNNFRAASQSCVNAINSSWAAIDEVVGKDGGVEALARTFKVCKLDGAEGLKGWLQGAWANVAMVNYPMPTNFLAPLPAYPIAEICRAIDHTSGSLLDKISAGVNIFYNFTGQIPSCYDLSADPNGEDNWGYQYCTQMTMPMESNPLTSMFPPTTWNLTEVAEGCEKMYNVTPRADWILTEFGGRNMAAYLRHFGSNILFAAGTLDPWTAGCVTKELDWRLPVILIKGGAHHLDLRSSNKDDPKSVVDARKLEAYWVRKWVADAWKHSGDPNAPRHKKADKMSFEVAVIVLCLSLFGLTTILLMKGQGKQQRIVLE